MIFFTFVAYVTHYWPFVRGTHLSLVNSPHKWRVVWCLISLPLTITSRWTNDSVGGVLWILIELSSSGGKQQDKHCISCFPSHWYLHVLRVLKKCEPIQLYLWENRELDLGVTPWNLLWGSRWCLWDSWLLTPWNPMWGSWWCIRVLSG